MSGPLIVLDDFHYTDITYIVLLHAGERMTVYDRNLHQAFPAGAKDIPAEAWNESQDTCRSAGTLWTCALRLGSGATSVAPSATRANGPASRHDSQW